MQEDTNLVLHAEHAMQMARTCALGPMHALSQFESFGNENWLYEDATGVRTVLRRYRHSSMPRVQFQVDFLAYLRRSGFPAPQVVQPEDGRCIRLDESGVAWALFSYIDGREYDFSRDSAEQAARALAQFHLLGVGFPGTAPPMAHRPSLRECWQQAEQDVQELRSLFTGVEVGPELDYLAQWWHEVMAAWPLDRFDALPAGLVHGDYHGRNLAFAGGRLAGVFDFDDVGPGPLVHDLAFGLHKFARESRFSLRLRPHFVSAFLAAYEDVRPLAEEERQALTMMIAMTYPPNPDYYRFYRDHHGTNLERRLKREINAMRELREQAGRLSFG